MKSFNYISVSVLLITSVFLFLESNVASFQNHTTTNIENISGIPSYVTSTPESLSEEEVSCFSTVDTFQMINSGIESYSVGDCFFPARLNYSIWQPPENI